MRGDDSGDRSRSVLVTGGAGFLGRALVRSVGEHTPGWEAVCYDLPEHTVIEPDPDHPAASAGRARADLDAHVARSSGVIHAAAVADLYVAARRPELNWRVNVEGTRNVAQACARHGVPMVYVSTCCAYGSAGDDGRRLTEDEPCRPTEDYARAKLAGEDALRDVGGLRWRTVRIATLYGPGMRSSLFSAVALDHVMRGLPVTVHGDGLQTRCYVHVADAAAAIWTVLRRGQDGVVYNAAGPDEITVLDTIRAAERAVGRAAVVVHGADRPGQIRRQVVESGRLRALGWRPTHDYDEGMRQAARAREGQGTAAPSGAKTVN